MRLESARASRRIDEELPPWGVTDESVIAKRIKAGARDENTISNDVFFTRHPELPRISLRTSQKALVAEWLDIRDRLVRPALAKAAPPAAAPDVALGTLTCNVPGKSPFAIRSRATIWSPPRGS